MKYKFKPLAVGLLVLGSCLNPNREKSTDLSQVKNLDYAVYGGNKAGNRYSPLNQINLDNVKNLQVAWMYDSSEKPDPNSTTPQRPKAIQCQPIVVNGVLYGTSAELKLFALNAGTGEQLWRFEPEKDEQKFNTSRGVVYWESGDDKRILYSVGSRLYAINAVTGQQITSFGANGYVDLHEGLQTNLDHDVSELSVTASSPGVVYKNTFIIGSSVSESGDAAPGHVRAFDVVTGKLKWVFHTIPQPGEYGYDTWPPTAYKYIGATNNWSGLVVDEKRGTVYFGTGSPASDFYGGDRQGENLFATCIMALNAETGQRVWHYQTIHHDLWDRDHPSPPNLATVKHNGKKVDVVVQATKDGLVYVLDRDTGVSLFPVEERPVPTSPALPGEHPFPTQKFPLKPAPFAHQVFTEEDITDISPEAHAYVKERFAEMRTDHKFAPPTEKGTILFGYSGGAEWGGNSISPDGILYQNANDDPWILQMVSQDERKKEMAAVTKGNGFYLANCAVCHGRDRKGSGSDFPSLTDVDKKYNAAGVLAILESGRGRMPAFTHIPKENREAIVRYLLNKETAADKVAGEHSETGPTETAKKESFPYVPQYVNKVWKKFTDQNGYPAIKPPWGTLNAIDLNTGEYLWRVPLGEYPELAKKGVPTTGTESYGGPVVTGGNLVFIAGTRDEKIRAFDRKTGQVVWEYQLPAGGFATPITYMVDGKQYVVIAAGGARGLKGGGNYVAFALP